MKHNWIILLATLLCVGCGSPLTEGQRTAIKERARDLAVYNKSLEELNEFVENMEGYLSTSPELVELSMKVPDNYVRSVTRSMERMAETVEMTDYVMKSQPKPIEFLYTLCDSIESHSWIEKTLCKGEGDELSNKLGMLAGTVMFRAADYTTGIFDYQDRKTNLLNVLQQEIYHDYHEIPGYLASYYYPLIYINKGMKDQGDVRVVYIYPTEGGSDQSYIVGFSNQTAYCITFHSADSSSFNYEEVEFDSSIIDYDIVELYGL